MRGYAGQLELDLARYDADIEGGELSGVRATPAFFVGGEIQDVVDDPT